MKSVKILLWLLGAVLAGLLLPMLPSFLQHGDTPEREVPTFTVENIDLKVTVDAVGVLDAARFHTISSSLRGDKGKIIYIITDGSRVNKGDVLIRLDPTPFEEEVRKLKGQVSSLDAAHRSALQLLELEKNNVEQALKTAEFNIRVARLELSKLVDGTGPIQTAQYKNEMEKAGEEYLRYKAYVDELNDLQSDDDPGTAAELYLARKKMKELQEKYDAARKKYDSYRTHVLPAGIEAEKAKVEKYEMEYNRTKQGGIYKIAAAKAKAEEIKGRLESSRSFLQLAEAELEKTVITAPFDGITVLSEIYRNGRKRKPRIGDRVLQNQPLLYLPDISTMIVRTRIREIDLYKVEKGRQCLIRADAYPNSEYRGEVSVVGGVARERREGGGGEKYFDLVVTLENRDTRLRPGMTARVTIIADVRKGVPAVPIQALFGKDRQHFCYRLQGEKFIAVPVTVGWSTSDRVEILSGLGAGDEISLIAPPPSRLE